MRPSQATLHAYPRLSLRDVTASLLYGFAHLCDLGGTLIRNRGRYALGPAGDRMALRQDWLRAEERVLRAENGKVTGAAADR